MIPGDTGVRRTVNDMLKFVATDVDDKEIKRVAASLKRKTVSETIYATYMWITANFNYHTDGNNEFVTSPWISIRKASPYPYFDCDDMTVLLITLLAANSIESAIKVIAWRETDPPNQFTHVYAIAHVPGRGWIPLDLVMKKDGFGNERPRVFRSMIVEVPQSALASPTLSDEQVSTIDMDWNALGNEVGERIYGGESMSAVLKDVVRRVCLRGLQSELKMRQPMLIAGGVGIATVFMATGFFLHKTLQRKPRKLGVAA
jgi:hypothetical protein